MPNEILELPADPQEQATDDEAVELGHAALIAVDDNDPARHIHEEFPSVSPRPNSVSAPRFIKEFSKENSPEERSQLASELWAKRVAQTEAGKTTSARTEELSASIENRSLSLGELIQEIQALESELEDISTGGIGKALKYLRSRRLKKLKGGYDELEHHQQVDLQNKEAASNQQASLDAGSLQEMREQLDMFYETEAAKWAKTEYSKEDVAKLFSEEHLASLSLDDYTLLLKRFPGHMVTHVTRQGIRDHLGLMAHTEGEGEYSDSFIRMLRDGRLRSPIGVHLAEEAKEKALAGFLQLDHFPDKEKALQNLDGLVEEYSDRMAVHFASEEVADMYYGSERGNEIFITYPSAFIASQFYFQGRLTESGGGYWNDQWVWANEERGMDLDAGIIFIPAETSVNRETGSRYKLDESHNPIVNENLLEAVRKIMESSDFDELMALRYKLPEKFNFNREDWDWAEKDNYGDSEMGALMKQLTERLASDFGITDKKTQFSILNRDFFDGLTSIKTSYNNGATELLDSHLQNMGMYFMPAEDTITAQDFWENYFQSHPSDRPSKVVYYKGDSPSKALDDWKAAQGVHGGYSTNHNLGFDENEIAPDSAEATAGSSRFRDLAEKVIDDFYAQQEVAT